MENNILIYIGVAVGSGILGLGAAILFLGKGLFDPAERIRNAEEMLVKTEKEKEEIVKMAKERAHKTKERLQHEIKDTEERVKKLEEALKYKEETVGKKQKRNEELRLKMVSQKEESSGLQEGIKKLERKFTERLCEKTGMNLMETKEQIIEKYITETEEEAKERFANQEEHIKENAVRMAKKVLVNAIQRMCSPTSVETKVILIKVPRDEIKGKIVGKEGGNILEFEKLLEVDIIFNDMPSTISISGYNLVNRRIAQKAIESLIRERRNITPELLKETIKKAGLEIDKELYEIGEKALKMLDIKSVDKELVKTIGRLQYRTSYGQNIMKHSLEVSWIATMLGSEVGINVNICKIAGFLHDLGKAIDQDPNVQGTHDFLTKELMTKYNFSPEEIHAAWTHHDSEPPRTAEALMVKAADAVSAGRPGARQESMEKYTERIMALEDAGRSFGGVKKAYAISAGRELRVFVDSEQISDDKMKGLAEQIAGKIQKEISYPGKIKVNTIRRTGFTETAK